MSREPKADCRDARLYVRPMTPEDIPALRAWMPDKSLYTYWGKGPGKAEKNPELLFAKERRPSKSFHLGIARKEDNRVIGDLWVYLIENDRMACVAVRLARECHGRGYGTRHDAFLLREHGTAKAVDAGRCTEHRVVENPGKVRLHAGGAYQAGQNGQYVVRLLSLWHSENG